MIAFGVMIGNLRLMRMQRAIAMLVHRRGLRLHTMVTGLGQAMRGARAVTERKSRGRRKNAQRIEHGE